MSETKMFSMKQIQETANKIISDTSYTEIGNLSETEMLILIAGFRKLIEKLYVLEIESLYGLNLKEAAQQLRAVPSDKRSEASRENGKKGGRPKNRICPICGKSVSVYRFADQWRFNQHYTDEKREGSIYPYYECAGSYSKVIE
jgi:hypothetical protein